MTKEIYENQVLKTSPTVVRELNQHDLFDFYRSD